MGITSGPKCNLGWAQLLPPSPFSMVCFPQLLFSRCLVFVFLFFFVWRCTRYITHCWNQWGARILGQTCFRPSSETSSPNGCRSSSVGKIKPCLTWGDQYMTCRISEALPPSQPPSSKQQLLSLRAPSCHQSRRQQVTVSDLCTSLALLLMISVGLSKGQSMLPNSKLSGKAAKADVTFVWVISWMFALCFSLKNEAGQYWK